MIRPTTSSVRWMVPSCLGTPGFQPLCRFSRRVIAASNSWCNGASYHPPAVCRFPASFLHSPAINRRSPLFAGQIGSFFLPRLGDRSSRTLRSFRREWTISGWLSSSANPLQALVQFFQDGPSSRSKIPVGSFSNNRLSLRRGQIHKPVVLRETLGWRYSLPSQVPVVYESAPEPFALITPGKPAICAPSPFPSVNSRSAVAWWRHWPRRKFPGCIRSQRLILTITPGKLAICAHRHFLP